MTRRNESLKTQSEIRERLVALIARNTGVTAKSVERDSPIWNHFPQSSDQGTYPTVTSFIDDVHSEFNVYLTEEEWEDPTPDSLAKHIRAKLENPAASLTDWTRDRTALKQEMLTPFVVFVMVGTAILFAAVGSWTVRLLWGLASLLIVIVMLVAGYRNKSRKLDASAPKK